MSVIRYSPVGLTGLQHQVNRLLDKFDEDFLQFSEELGSGKFAPAMDVREDSESYLVHLEVPGVKRDQIEIALTDGLLVVRGQRRQAQTPEGVRARRVERAYGAFARSVNLPKNIDADAVTANLEDGILTVRLPKAAEARPRQITITQGGPVHEGRIAAPAEDKPLATAGETS